MQRLKVVFTEQEYIVLKHWNIGQNTKITSISKEIEIENKGSTKKIKFLFEGNCGSIKFTILTQKYYIFIKGQLKSEYVFKDTDDLINLFKLVNSEDGVNFKNEEKDIIFVKLSLGYKTEYINEIHRIRYYIYKRRDDLLPIIQYLDFSKEEEVMLAMYSYIIAISDTVAPHKLKEPGELIGYKLNVFGYERGCKPKEITEYNMRIFEEGLKKNKRKMERKAFTLSVMTELFFEVYEDKRYVSDSKSSLCYSAIYWYMGSL